MIVRFQEFIKKQDKKILIVDSKENYNKIAKNYCIKNHTTISNIKVFTIKDLASSIFYSNEAIDLNSFVGINNNVASTIISYLLKTKNPIDGMVYGFIPVEAVDLRTPAEVLKALNQLRFGNVLNKNYKYEYLMDLDKDYKKYLEEHNYYDYNRMLDLSIDYIKGLSKDEIKNIYALGDKINLEVLDNVLEKLTYKEGVFLDLFKNAYDVSYEGINYLPSDKTINKHFAKCYGAYNEVYNIVNEIKKNNLKSGDINVLYTDPIYENLIRAIFEMNDIKYSLKEAHANSTNLIQLFNDIIEFYKNDFLYENLYKIVKNPIFKIEGGSAVRRYTSILNENICNSKERYIDFINRYDINANEKNKSFVEFLNDLVNAYSDEYDTYILFQNIYNLINKYIYRNNEYLSLIDKLYDLGIYFTIMQELDKDVLKPLDYIKECIDGILYSDVFTDDSIAVINLSEISVLDRKYTFVLGLSSSQIKQKEVESAIFSDSEYKDMLDMDYYVELAENSNKEYERILSKTIESQPLGDIYYEYMYFNTVDFKPSSPSVYYLNLLEDNNEEDISYEYDERELKPNRNIIKKYVDDFRNTNDSYEENLNNINNAEISAKIEDLNITVDNVSSYVNISDFEDENKKWYISASGLGNLVTCPMCYIYQYVKKLPNIQFKTINSYSWLDALARGNLFHHTFENYFNETYKKYNTCNLNIDEDILNASFNKALEVAVEEKSYPNEVTYEKESKVVYEKICSYLTRLKAFYDEEAKQGRFYKNIGNELEFGKDHNYNEIFDVSYEDEYQYNNINYKYKLFFVGSIDRLDGYVVDNILHFRIIDYKTSNEKGLKVEILHNSKIQHYIYGIAAMRYYEINKELLEKMFDTKISNAVVDDMQYDLVLEDKSICWSNSFDIKKYNEAIPSNFTSFKFPQKVRDAIKIVDLIKNQKINIDSINDDLVSYFDINDVKNPNLFSNYKHICRMEINTREEDVEDEESSGE